MIVRRLGASTRTPRVPSSRAAMLSGVTIVSKEDAELELRREAKRDTKRDTKKETKKRKDSKRDGGGGGSSPMTPRTTTGTDARGLRAARHLRWR